MVACFFPFCLREASFRHMGVVTGGLPTSGRGFLRERSKETSGNGGVPMLLSLGRSRHRAKGLPRLGREGLVTEAAAERDPLPPRTSCGSWGWAARPGLAAPRGGRSFLPCLSPGPGPGRARHGLRDRLSPRPETPIVSQRRSTPTERQASVAAAAALTILSLGSAQSPQPPPPSLPQTPRQPAHLAHNQ